MDRNYNLQTPKDYFENFDILIDQDTLFKDCFNKFTQSDQFEDKLAYNHKDKNFEFLKNESVYRNSDKTQMIAWIRQNRLPQFLQSDTFLNYQIGRLLTCEANKKFGSHGSVELDEKERVEINANLTDLEGFLNSTINTPGEELIQTWRHIQAIYFRPKIIEFENINYRSKTKKLEKLPEHDDNISSSGHSTGGKSSASIRDYMTLDETHKLPHFRGIYAVLNKYNKKPEATISNENKVKLGCDLFQVRTLIEKELVSYWLPRFLSIKKRRAVDSENQYKFVTVRPVQGPAARKMMKEHTLVSINRLKKNVTGKEGEATNPNATMPRLSKSFEVESKPIIRPKSSKKVKYSYLAEQNDLEDDITQTFCLLYSDLEFGSAFGQFCCSKETAKANAAHNVGGREKLSWKHAFLCWSAIQKYRSLYKLESLNVAMIKQIAKEIQIKYVIPFMDEEVINQVYSQINPPFDDLFDDAEEVVLLTLVDAAKEYMRMNRSMFSRLKLTQYKRKLRLSIMSLRLRQTNNDLVDNEIDRFLSVLPEAEFTCSYWSEKNLWKNLKVAYRQLGFSDVLLSELDKEELIMDRENDGKYLYDEDPDLRREYFKPHFLEYVDKLVEDARVALEQADQVGQADQADDNSSDDQAKDKENLTHEYEMLQTLSNDIKVWCEIERIRLSKSIKDRNKYANLLKTNWLNEKYFFGSKYSPAKKFEQNRILQSSGGYKNFFKNVPRLDVVSEIQRLVKNRLESSILLRYYGSEEFVERQKYLKKLEKERRKMMKLQEAKASRMKAMEGGGSRPYSGYTEIDNFQDFESDHTHKARENEFRKDMKDPAQVVKFYNYLSVWKTHSARFLPNDLLFYLEILKYQDLFHSHKCRDVVDSKIKSMINTYIKCQVALQQGEKKELQIDIWGMGSFFG